MRTTKAGLACLPPFAWPTFQVYEPDRRTLLDVARELAPPPGALAKILDPHPLLPDGPVFAVAWEDHVAFAARRALPPLLSRAFRAGGRR